MKMKRILTAVLATACVCFLAACGGSGASGTADTSGISVIEKDTTEFTENTRLTDLLPNLYKALQTARENQLFVRAVLQEATEGGITRYSLDYPEMFEDLMNALPQIIVEKETDIVSTDADADLVIELTGGAEAVLSFNDGHLVLDGRYYEISGDKDFKAVLSDIREYGRVIE